MSLLIIINGKKSILKKLTEKVYQHCWEKLKKYVIFSKKSATATKPVGGLVVGGGGCFGNHLV